MNVRGFLSRAVIALWIALGVAGASQAQPARNWMAAAPNVSAGALEISTAAVNQLAGTTFWETFLKKSSWKRVATRVGASCAAGGLTYLAYNGANQHTTWFVKGMRSVTACGAATAGAASFELMQTTLVAAGAPELVALAGGIVVLFIVGGAVEKVVELIWEAHTVGKGMATVSGDGRTATIPRRRLTFVDEEYFDHTTNPAFTTNLKHPSARSSNGSHLGHGRNAGNQWVGGYQIYLRNPGCASNPWQC
jgi:hypothetical protein